MKIRKFHGVPDHIAIGFNPLLPDTGDGVAGGTIGGAGAPPAPSIISTPPPAPAPTSPAMGTPPVPGQYGYAEGVPLAELPVEQVAAYWRHHARKHEDASKAKDVELAALKPKAEQYDALAEASKTETERAIETARAEAAAAAREAAMAEARTTYGVQVVQARLTAALSAKGLTPEQMTALAGDGSRFIGADGVDTAALDAFLAALPDKAAAPPPPNLGGGRTSPPATSGVAAGADLWSQRHKKPSATA